jgi:hypothetical protein
VHGTAFEAFVALSIPVAWFQFIHLGYISFRFKVDSIVIIPVLLDCKFVTLKILISRTVRWPSQLEECKSTART